MKCTVMNLYVRGRNTDLPNEDCDVILVAIIRRDRRNGSSNGYSAIRLNKANTKKVVTTGCPIRVTLHCQKKNLQIFIKDRTSAT